MEAFPLSDEQNMLVRIRDTLYEGSWDDFVADLQSRAEGRPHVYETTGSAVGMVETIRRHLGIITEMQAWESRTGRRLVAKQTV